MIITKINLDNLSEISVDIKDNSSNLDMIAMLRYLDRAKCENHIYINWNKHIYDKNILDVI